MPQHDATHNLLYITQTPIKRRRWCHVNTITSSQHLLELSVSSVGLLLVYMVFTAGRRRLRSCCDNISALWLKSYEVSIVFRATWSYDAVSDVAALR